MNQDALNVGIEYIPDALYEFSRDWTALALTRLLAEPLFFEDTERTISSRLIDCCDRVSEDTWRLSINTHATWSDGRAIRAVEICQQILASRLASAAALTATLMIKSARAISDRELEIHTRIPVAFLDRILSHPGFAPRDRSGTSSSGPYIAASINTDSACLHPVRTGYLPLSLIVEPSDELAFTNGQVAISGPMTTGPRRWSDVCREPTSTILPLDLVYALILPDVFPLHSAHLLHQSLDRELACGLVPSVTPCMHLTDLWAEETLFSTASTQAGVNGVFGGDFKLTYTSFSGNAELAEGVACALRRLGFGIAPQTVSYADFINPSLVENRESIRLAVIAAPWPHPAAPLAPYYFSRDHTQMFAAAFEAALACDNLTSSIALSYIAEKILVQEGMRTIPLGKISGCLRSRLGKHWFPPSGWLDYSKITSTAREYRQ